MKKRIALFLIFIFIFLFVDCFCFSKPEVAALNYHYNNSNIVINDDNSTVEDKKVQPIDIDALRKKYSNNDIVGVVKIDSIGIDGIVLKGINNEFYLNHDINKKSSIFGTLFVDFRNKSDLASEKQINIYGHNSRKKEYQAQLDFYNLNNIVNKKTFDELSDIYFYVDNEVLVYKPLAVKVITTDYEYTRLDLSNPELLKKHLKNLTSNTMYCKGDCTIKEDNDIIILQTCYYDPSGSYLLLIGIK